VDPPERLTVRFVVGRDGAAGSMELLKPAPAPLSEAIAAALRGCAFEPGRAAGGAPVAAWVVLPLRLAGRPQAQPHLGTWANPRRDLAGDQPALPARGLVVDPGGLVDGASYGRLVSIGHGRRGRTWVPELTVFVLPSLEGRDLHALARRAYLAWRLGSSQRDDGLLLVVAVKERAWVLQVGLAVEPLVDGQDFLDAVGERIDAGLAEERLGPRLVEAAEGLVQAARRTPAASPAERTRGFDVAAFVAIGLIVVPLLLSLVGRRLGRVLTLPVTPPQHRGWRVTVTDDGAAVVVRSAAPRGAIATLLAAAVLIVALLATLQALRGVDRIACSAPSRTCTVTLDGARDLLPLSRVGRFVVTSRPWPTGPQLRAVTAGGNVVVADDQPEEALRRQADALDAFLVRATEEAPAFQHDRAAGWPWAALRNAALMVLPLLLVWLARAPWRLTLDRAGGTATLARLGRRQRRPLAELTGVQVWTPALAALEQARRERRAMPYARPIGTRRCLVLREAAGGAWPVTPWLARGRPSEQLEAAARQVSERLGLPLVPEPRPVAPGTVPPPLP